MYQYIEYARRNQEIMRDMINIINDQNSHIRTLNRTIHTSNTRQREEDSGLFVHFINNLNNQVNLLTAEEINEHTRETIYSDCSSNETMCPISHEQFEENTDVLELLNCNHIFRPQHIRRWLQTSRLCPVCRNDITRNGNTTPTNSSDNSLNDLFIDILNR